MEKLILSKRLMCVAEWIKESNVRRVADVGTDHGYLPIWLALNTSADTCIAMDVRKKPLEKAAKHIVEYGVQDKVSVRLGNGLESLEPGEADAITICGMGGRLIRSILEAGRDKYDAHTQLILSPQSEIRQFRHFLLTSGYVIVREHFLKEDNQFYCIMDCRYNPVAVISDASDTIHDVSDELYERFGKDNLESHNADLYEYLQRELEINVRVMDMAVKAGASARIEQVKEDLFYIRKALEEYYGGSTVTACKGETE